ncbi:hypothetical protein [Enterobacter sp. ENT03]|uniref:hypothetical protein n=1 Tax=Enterobacter sp. ENT03 TaxID=2854780 RepID=UPI001C43B1A7|nr:hypothetical protein [Enterobacter sp. ENT03]MBV7405695.1 hypothetical protein [Enterobacter sp. ENT03]
MKKVIFWGWYSDYDIATIRSLRSKYNVHNKSMSKFTRIILGLFKFFLNRNVLGYLYKICIADKLSKEEIIVFSDDIIFYDSILSHIHCKRKIIVFRNKLPIKFSSTIDKLQACGFEMYTFDNSDAKLYNIIYKGQYLPCVYSLKSVEQKNNAYFLGLNKGRQSILMALSDKLSERGITPDITLVKKYNFGIKFYHGKISYLENVNKLLESTYVIDIVSEGQTGLTLRALEATFYHRKLITNNPAIKQYEFYNENNILILNDEFEIPDSFITERYQPVSSDLLKKYTAESYYSDIIG